MSDLSKILADNQRGMFKLTAPSVNKPSNIPDIGYPDSENETVVQARTSTPIRTKTAAFNNTPLLIRSNNTIFRPHIMGEENDTLCCVSSKFRQISSEFFPPHL